MPPPLRPSRGLRSSFRDSTLQSCQQLLITKKTVDFDYVAIDAGGLVGGALRLTKSLNTEQRRHREVARHVVQGIQQTLKRVGCRRSLLLALDGAESLGRAAATRSTAQSRRLESRLSRLPATALMQAVEDRLARMVPDRSYLPPEVVLAGTCVSGSAEEKMVAWALDLAGAGGARDGRSGGDVSVTAAATPSTSMALVGSQDLYLCALGLTPYYAVSSLVLGAGADVRQMTVPALLAWLGLDQLAREGHSCTVARARTDMLFLLLLASGGSAAELPAVAGLRLPLLLQTYHRRVLDSGAGAGDASRPAGATAAVDFLFADVPGNALEMNLTTLVELLRPFVDVPGGGGVVDNPRFDVRADSYLEFALQSHAAVCLGYTPNPLFVPAFDRPTTAGHVGQVGSAAAPGMLVTVGQLLSHVRHLLRTGVDRRRAAGATPPPPARGAGEAKAVDEAVGSAASEAVLPAGGEESMAGLAAVEPALARFNPFYDRSQPMTAGEYTLLCQGSGPAVEATLQMCMSGSGSLGPGSLVQPTPELVKAITAADARGALDIARTALSLAHPTHAHRCLCFSPSYCWVQNPKSKLWRMAYVDLGRRAAELEVRRVRNNLAGVGMSQQESDDGPAQFDAAAARWRAVTHFPCGAEAVEAAAESGAPQLLDHRPPHSLKVLTWNVMFDRYSGQPTPLGMPGIDWCSPQRYPVLAKLIAQEDADVVGMQEVEPAFLSFLAEQPWCQERYLLSCTPSSAVVHPWGVALLVHRRRLPLTALTHVNVPAWSGHSALMPMVTLRLGARPVHVAAVHLLAPFTKNNESLRTAQDQALRHRLTRGIASGEDCVAMGDFNDWPTNTFEMPAETHYRECWPLVHPRDPGNTLDETNTFCKLKIEEIFFGRSDKVFVRSERLRPVSAHLVGTRSVNDENGNTEAPAYLFPSDHYGVAVTFASM